MKAIVIMFDSLNRNYLSCYGNNETITPNFKRLAEKSVTFDNFYAGSLPCMPARREMHTGRYNFLHRSWGPLEPYDDSMPQILSDNKVYTHLVTDHCHYWQDGGAAYHTKFSSCDFIRGQEGDFWFGNADGFKHNLDIRRQDNINRREIIDEDQYPHVKTFSSGMKFLADNVNNDNWYLQLEYFDPHEPFFVPQKYRDMYNFGNAQFDWPYYSKPEHPDHIREARINYMALLTMCDNYLGKVLDFMDCHDMWKDTMLIVNTDHGFLLGEHGYFAKNYMPTYNEIAHIPFFIWNPLSQKKNIRCSQLSQTIDIAPTILDFWNIPKPENMTGESLLPAITENKKIRDYALFGYFGKHVNITDGNYVYMRCAVKNSPLFNYTIMPHNIFTPFDIRELQKTEKEMKTFLFTKNVPLMKIPTSSETAPDNSAYWYNRHMEFGNLLFNIVSDKNQKNPLNDEKIEKKLICEMKKIMVKNDAPDEQFERLGLDKISLNSQL